MARRDFQKKDELDERVVHIARTAKVVKGGRRFAFRAIVVVGDNQGSVGVGIGKARGVPDAIRKGAEQARKNIRKVHLLGSQIQRGQGAFEASLAGHGRHRWWGSAGSGGGGGHPRYLVQVSGQLQHPQRCQGYFRGTVSVEGH